MKTDAYCRLRITFYLFTKTSEPAKYMLKRIAEIRTN